MTWQTLPLPAAPAFQPHSLLRQARATWRFLGFLLLCVAEALEWLLVVALPGRTACRATRAAWLSRFCRRIISLLGLRVTYRGEPPTQGLLVSNHLSYLDIIVLAARTPLVFVAKRELRSWPGLGVLIAWAGTLFVNRERKTDVARMNAAMAEALEAGTVVCLFPEGTSSGGQRVLPFHSPLLAPAVAAQAAVKPAALHFTLPHGNAEEEVCYWGEMTFFPHFLNLLGHPAVEITVEYGSARAAGTDRKQLSTRLHGEVSRMLQRAAQLAAHR